MSPRPSLPFANQEFVSYLQAVLSMQWLIPFVGLFVLIPEISAGGKRTWVLASATALVGLGFLPSWRYRRNPRSMRALFLMTDGAMTSFLLLLPLGLAEMAYVWLNNFWIYRDYLYLYVYVGLFVAIFLYFALFMRGDFRQHFVDQMSSFRHYIDEGKIDETTFYNILMSRRGAKEGVRRATSRRYAGFLMPLAVILPLIGYWGGEDYLVYAAFLALVIVAPCGIAPRVLRRSYQFRYLGTRDLVITTSGCT